MTEVMDEKGKSYDWIEEGGKGDKNLIVLILKSIAKKKAYKNLSMVLSKRGTKKKAVAPDE